MDFGPLVPLRPRHRGRQVAAKVQSIFDLHGEALPDEEIVAWQIAAALRLRNPLKS
jgi:hypothetical protein